jgi:hypothetical protein
MKRLFFPVLVLPVFFLVLSCNPLAGPLPAGSADVPAVQFVSNTGEFSYTVDPGPSPHDVYFVFTNTNLTQDASSKPSVDTSPILVDGVALPAPVPQPMYSYNSDPKTGSERISEQNRRISERLYGLKRGPGLPPQPGPSRDAVGATAQFNDVGLTGDVLKNATCRYVNPAIAVADGSTRTLNVWVADNCWIAGGTKTHLVDDTMVAALVARYLQSGLGNDIYDWDTSVLGAEWGDTGHAELIPFNKEITILLSDIEEDDSDSGGVVGYFSYVNNFTAVVAANYGYVSNQRIMFVMDAVMYANPNNNGYSISIVNDGTGWAETDYWAEAVFSTLAHEFQHMIQFYQKQVINNVADTDIWINEMCSMVMEDLVADKLGVEGPRGVKTADAGSAGNTGGRIPDFNQSSYWPLAITNYRFYYEYYPYPSYASSYVFGAWLARNYGGAGLLKAMVQSADTDQDAVVNAAAAFSGRQDEDMGRLLQKWAVAVLLSDLTTTPVGYAYNTGGWMNSTEGGVSYNLGSINIFSYTPTLKVFDKTGSVPSVPFTYSSNVYYQAAQGLDAPQTWSINIPSDDIAMSVVVK